MASCERCILYTVLYTSSPPHWNPLKQLLFQSRTIWTQSSALVQLGVPNIAAGKYLIRCDGEQISFYFYHCSQIII